MKQIIPLPQTARDVLLSFLMFREADGLQSIARHIDFTGATRRHITGVTTAKLPAQIQQVAEPPTYNPRADFVRALSAPAFQTAIRETIVAAFPEKRRLINIHIAKCAGTDLEVTLRRRHPFIHHTTSIPQATPPVEFFESLRLLAMGLQFSSAIALSGHVKLSWYLRQNMIRAQDDVFTTLRNPRDRIYSQISYMLMVMNRFRGTTRFDTTGWLAAIGMTALDDNADPDYLVSIGRRLLRSPEVMRPDGICDMLGEGTAESAIQNLILADVEITDTVRYSAWRTAKFAFSPAETVNRSQPLFTRAHASAEDAALVETLVTQDIILYDLVQRKLAATDALSIRGRVLQQG